MPTADPIASIQPGPQSTTAWRCRQAALPIVSLAAAFIVDIRTPNGLLDGFLYVFAILACQWVPTCNFAIYTAWGVMLPMVLGFFLSPMGAPMWMAVTNRLGVMIIIWVTAFVVRRGARAAKQKELAFSEIQRRFYAAEHLAHDERAGLSDWLREDISIELAMIDWRLNRFSRSPGRGFDLRTEALVLRQAVRRARHSVYGKELRLREVAVGSR